jgi:mxaA protein
MVGRKPVVSAAAAVLALAGSGIGAEAQIVDVSIASERTVGYLIGDLIRHRVEIVAEGDWSLAPATLPKTGRRAYWLELGGLASGHRREGGRTIVTLDLVYQTFYAPLEARQQTIPGFAVTLAAPDGRTVSATVPAWRFGVSPLRELSAGGVSGQAGGGVDILPAEPPRPVPTRNAAVRAVAAAGLAALAGLALTHHHAVFPFAARRGRPFAAVRRALRRLPTGHHRDALTLLHRAFDRAAGRRLFAEDIEAFLAEHPVYAAERSGIAAFFAASVATFYADAPADAEALMPAADIGRLADRLAAAERRGA